MISGVVCAILLVGVQQGAGEKEEKVEEIIEASPARVALSYSCSPEPPYNDDAFTTVYP